MLEIILASHNQHKVTEIRDILNGVNIDIKSLHDFNYLNEIIEDGMTLEENALIKARTIHRLLDVNVIGEDTGLEIESLNMEPGVFTARYAGPNKDAKDNMRKVLENLKGQKNRKARFRTVIALIFNGQEYLIEGIVNGLIAEKISGFGGFGYDPIFIPDGYNETFAQLPSEIKNGISHRSKAVSKLVAKLKLLSNQ